MHALEPVCQYLCVCVFLKDLLGAIKLSQIFLFFLILFPLLKSD